MANVRLDTFEKALRHIGIDWVVRRGLGTVRDEFQSLELSWPARDNPLGILIGNTLAIWPHFLAHVRAEPDLSRHEHPLDTWVERSIRSALDQMGANATPYFAHHKYLRGYLPLQHFAQQLGALALSPSHLSVHPEYGPWLALRALIVLDLEADDGAASGGVFPPATEPCASCAAPCRAPFELAAQNSSPLEGAQRVVGHWQQWLRVRDACPQGRPFRYSDEQISYHYARDRRALGL